MWKIYIPLALAAIGFSLAVSPVFAQNSLSGANFRRQMISLMEEFKGAKTDEQRREIHERIMRAREQYRAENPPRELSPAEIAAQRQKMEELLKKDPFRWEVYQLRQAMADSKNQEERDGYNARIQALMAKHAAEAEAKLTPEQRAAAQERQDKYMQMQVELQPLIDSMHAANTDAARRHIRDQIREIFTKYR